MPSVSEPPLGTGPPTREELLTYYPPFFTFHQLKTFVNSGDLALLKRDPKLHKRYQVWTVGIKQEYGSLENYMKDYRLQWGKPDNLSTLSSQLVDDPKVFESTENATPREYFTADIPRSMVSIIMNDWPVAVPVEVEHSLVWTQLPIIHPAVVPKAIEARVHQDGLWGFTGLESPPPSPSTLPECLPTLAPWGVTLDQVTRSEKGTEEEEEMVRNAGKEVGKFVRGRWDENVWETAWFVNPPRIQSVPGLAHIHVFARKKTA
ncbi:hypothetical protein DL96DRAFT_1285631 [Flagelloscypha sp. PMI_526]|nr:hypothetical protein DL96DRAFT_1285631 [Flagelloscypha sp. PMI_526]